MNAHDRFSWLTIGGMSRVPDAEALEELRRALLAASLERRHGEEGLVARRAVPEFSG